MFPLIRERKVFPCRGLKGKKREYGVAVCVFHNGILEKNFCPEAKDVSGTAEWEFLNFKGESIQKQTIGEKTLKSGKPVQEKFTLALPAHVRGPHNLVFSFRDNTGKTHSRTFYFGAVGTPGKPSPKIALEAAASQDVRLLIPFYRDFGIGGAKSPGQWMDTVLIP